MSDDDDYSFKIDIKQYREYDRSPKKRFVVPRPSVKPPKDRVVRAPSDISVQKYSLPRKSPIPLGKLKRGILFLPCSRYISIQNCEFNKKSLKVPLRKKYKISSVDLRKRLHTEHATEEVKTIGDVDKDFFSIIKQPAKTYKLEYKSLTPLYNELLLLRQQLGYRKDCILKIEADIKRDLVIYEKSLQNCVQQAKYFEQFIAEDYHKSIALLRAHDHLRHEIDIQDLALQILIDEKFSIIAKLIFLEYKYRIQERYGRFLYYLAPSWWRAGHRDFARSVEIQSKGFDLGKCEDFDSFSIVFDNLVQECFSKTSKPAMFFTDPSQVVDLIHTVQNQQTHHFTHILKIISWHTSNINDKIKILKSQVRHDTKRVAKEVKSLQDLVKASEERGDELEASFFAVLTSTFYKAVASKDVLMITTHLEFAFEMIMGSKPINLNNVTMARTIEMIYLDYCQRIEAVSTCNLMAEVSKCIQLQQKKLKKARIATRELKSFAWLEKKLLDATMPAKKRSSWIQSKKGRSFMRPGQIYKNLTEVEREYLVNFTDWTPGTDPSHYLKENDTKGADK